MNFKKIFEAHSYQKQNEIYRYRDTMIIVALVLSVYYLVTWFIEISQADLVFLRFSFSISFCYVICAVLAYFPKTLRIGKYFIFVLLECSLIFMILFGESYYFSPYWGLFLPAFSYELLGRKTSIFLIGFGFLISIFYCYIPLGMSLIIYPYYNDTFYFIFPIMYAVFSLSGYFIFDGINKKFDVLLVTRDNYLRQAQLDNLTGLNNRYYFDSLVEKKMSSTETESIGLFILDIDDFKNINDTYGHLFGDEVLKKISKMIIYISGDDINVCRWGGEEFCILEFNQTPEDIVSLAETVRIMIMNTNFGDETKDIYLTVSIGTCWKENDLSLQKLQLFRDADKALYYAKESGKNKVVTDRQLKVIQQKEEEKI